MTGNVDIRLAAMAVTEAWLRSGSTDWSCSQALAAAVEPLVSTVLLPNLVWRSGRVEATVRNKKKKKRTKR